MKKEFIKPLVWGFVAGAIVLLIVVFATGWVVTGGSAQTKADEMAEKAVIDILAPICVAQFMQDPNKEERLKEFKTLESYGANNRTDYVKKQGWATMPGAKEPNFKVAEKCAILIAELEK